MKIFLLLTLIILVSCASTDYYYAKAVEKARKKAVGELPLLSDADRFEVKFGNPEIMRRRILDRSKSPYGSKNDIYHTWIVWRLPESDGQCVVVSGVGEGRMDDWTPGHVLIREIEKVEGEAEKVEKTSDEETNRKRAQ
jgi:hypothetical protein